MEIPITLMIRLIAVVVPGVLLTGVTMLILTSRLRGNLARARRVKERLRNLSRDQGRQRTRNANY